MRVVSSSVIQAGLHVSSRACNVACLGEGVCVVELVPSNPVSSGPHVMTDNALMSSGMGRDSRILRLGFVLKVLSIPP